MHFFLKSLLLSRVKYSIGTVNYTGILPARKYVAWQIGNDGGMLHSGVISVPDVLYQTRKKLRECQSDTPSDCDT